jgi:hypothetical protein
MHFGQTNFLGIWQETPGTFLTKVAVVVWIIQALLVLAASISAVRLVRKEKDNTVSRKYDGFSSHEDC